MRTKLFMLMLSIFVLAGFNASAATKVGTFGVPNSDSVAPLTVDSDRTMTIATDAGLLMSYSSVTTNETFDVADCGKTVLVTPSVNTTFTLPSGSSVPGCEIKLVATTGESTKKIIVDVASTDMLRGVINSAAVTTFAAGDSMISAGNTNDMISVISSGTTIWDVTSIRGTWSDNN